LKARTVPQASPFKKKNSETREIKYRQLTFDFKHENMTQAFSVRGAEKEDAKKIFEFICALEEKTFNYQEFFIHYRNAISANYNIYLVATTEGGEVIGFISCHGQILLHHNGMVFEVQELFVDAPYRKMGVGKLLMRALELQLAKREYVALEVTANIKRTETHDFYVRNDFAKTHYKFTRARR